MTRRLLVGALALGLAGTGALSSPAAADTDQPQDLDLSAVVTARLPGGIWSPAPIRAGAPPLHLSIAAADAAVCELSDDEESVEFLTVGDCHVTAYAPAYTGYTRSPDEPVTFTVSGHPTTTTLTAAPATREVGDQITLTAVVDSDDQGQPTGTVEFTRNGSSVGSDTLEGAAPGDDFATASTTVTAPVSGDLDYVATYVPGSPTTWAASDDTDRVVASKRTVTVTATASADAVAVGGTVTLDITAKNGATDVAPAVAPATVGTVTVDGDPVAVTWQTGTTTVTLPTTVVGPHDVEVTFRPADQTTYAEPIAVPASYDVGAVTTTELVVAPAGPLVGDGVQLTATVDSDGTGEPAGVVEFLRKGSGGTYTVIDTVTLDPAADPAGDRSAAGKLVTAESATARTYAARFVPADAAVHAASTSSDEVVTPVRRTVDVAVGTPVSPVALGQDVTIPIAGTSGLAETAVDQDATTTVTVDDTPVAGLTWTHGATSLVLTAPTAGTHTVVVTFVPDDDDRYATPTAVTKTFDVTVPTTTTVSAAPTGVLVGATATFTATVTTSGHGKPVGTVELLRVGAGGTLVAVDADTDPALVSGSSDTVTAELEVAPANATPTDYRVRFTPTDPADFIASSSVDRTLTAVRRTVAVAVAVPTTEVATTEAATVTVDATHGGTGVKGGGTTSVTFNGTPVTGLDWADGSESLTVTPSSTGTQTIVVTFVPDDTDRYATPAQVTRTFVAKHRQSITADAATAGPYYAEGTTTITSSGTRGTVTLAERTPSVCTVANGTVTFVTAGTCTVRVQASGNSSYLPGFRDVTLTVAARPVDVAVVLETLPAVYGDAVLISATATALGSATPLSGTGTVTVRRQGAPVGEADVLSAPYTFGGAKVTLSGVEVDDYDVTVTYTPPVAKTGIHATSTKTRTLSIGRATQNVVFGPSTGHLYVDETWSTPATGSRSGTAAALQVVGTPTICEVDGTDLHFKRSGTCTVKATVAQDSRYESVSDTKSFTVALRPVDVAVTVAAEDTGDATPRYQEWVVVTATATDRLDPTREVAGTGTIRVVTHDGATTPASVTFGADGVATRRFKPTALGSDTVKVALTPSNVAGVATYAARTEPTTADATFTVAKGRQSITWGASNTPAPASRLVDATWDSAARGGPGPGGETVLVTSLTPTVCSVSGTVVTMLAAAGSNCEIKAEQDATDFYLAAVRTATIAVTARPVTVGVTWPAGKHVYRQPVTITATARDTTAGANVPDLGTGAADSQRSGLGTIVVDGDVENVVFRNGVATRTFVPEDVDDFAVSATFTPNRALTYAVTPDAAATLTIDKADQAVLAPTVDPPAAPNIGDTWAPAVASGGSSAPVVITSLTTSVCTVTDRPVASGGPLVTFVALSGCTVRLSQAGDEHYEAATPVPVSVTVVKLAVDLTVSGQATPRQYGDATTLTFTAKANRAPHAAVAGTTAVTVTDVTTGVAVPTTGRLSVDAAAGTAVLTLGTELLTGRYDVRADFTATRDDLYGPTFALASFTITLAPQTVALATGQTAPSAVRVGSTSWTPVFATTASGTPVVLTRRDAASEAEEQPEYESDPDWNPPTHSCTVTGGTVAFVSQGSCVVRAVAPAVTRKYAASDPVDHTVAVTRVPVSLALTATPSTGVVVGDEVRVKAVAKVDTQAASGHGPLTVTGQTGLPSATDPWFGGGRFHTFSPARAGDYEITAFFHPDDPVTYQNIERVLTVSVAQGSQQVALLAPQPTAVLVNDTWTPVTSGGDSGNPVVVGVDEAETDLLPKEVPSDPDAYVCRVAAGVVSFVGHGTCQLVLSQEGNDDWSADELDLDPITISRTTTTVTLQAPTTPQVGVPYTVSARVVGGSSGGPIAGGGGGPVVVTIGGVEVARATGAWVDGVRTLTFTPDRAGALLATATYTATDEAAFAGDDDQLSATVAAGVQWVRIGLEPPSPAYVDATWTPRMSGAGAPEAAPSLSASPASVCTATSDTVTFRARGTCTVRATMAAKETAGSTSWAAATEERVVEVRSHPTTVVVAPPLPEQRFVARTIDVRAQVTGRASGTGTPVSVPGTVQFTVDGHPRGIPVTVSPTGLATAQITVPVDSSVDPAGGPYPHDFGALFVPTDAVYWADGTAAAVPVPISLNAQEIQPDGARSPLYIGQTWTPRVRISPSGALAPVVTLRAEDTDICSYDGTVVRLEAVDTVAPIDSTCDLDYTQPGNGEWAAATNRSQGVEVQLRPSVVDLTVGTASVASPVTLAVSVVSPAVAATLSPITSGLDAAAPAGTVTFAAGGVPVATVPVTLDASDPTKPGTASTSYTPGHAGDVAITATFEPTDGAVFADGTGSRTVNVAKATTTTTVTAVTPQRITALVGRSADPASTMGGSVTFSYTVVGSPAPAVELGTTTLRGDRRAVLTGSVPPADRDVVIRADYVGDPDHAASFDTRRRDLPRVTAQVEGTRTGWNGGPVTIRFVCAPSLEGGAAIASCPAPVTLRGDGRGQSVTRAGTAEDGGRTATTVTGIDIDDTEPSVRVGGTVAGASYRGTAPAATCLGSDALSGLASCEVTRTQLAGRGVRDTAVAIDRAGNRATASITFEVRQEWVVDAPLVRGGYQVKPGTTPRIVVRTEGPQPQLMLPGAKGKLVPAKLFTAKKIDNGIVTWQVDVKLPKDLRAGQRYAIGFRLAGDPETILPVRLDLVRKPATAKDRGQRKRR